MCRMPRAKGDGLKPVNENASIADGKRYLRANFENGVSCPCCGQHVKLYKRPIYSTMAAALIEIYCYFRKHHEARWLHVGDFLAKHPNEKISRSSDWAKLVHWDLLEAQQGERDDGSNRIGTYRITDLGRAFCEGRAKVWRRMYFFDGRVIGHDDDLISIREALGKGFDYSELMKEAANDNTEAPAQAKLKLI